MLGVHAMCMCCACVSGIYAVQVLGMHSLGVNWACVSKGVVCVHVPSMC